MSKAVELASLRITSAIEITKATPGQSAEFVDAVNLTEVYYRLLRHLHRQGELPEEAYFDMTEQEKAALKGKASFKKLKPSKTGGGSAT